MGLFSAMWQSCNLPIHATSELALENHSLNEVQTAQTCELSDCRVHFSKAEDAFHKQRDLED